MNISLEGSIRSCKVDSGWASRLESDRFLNPSNMICPVWNQHDSAGRPSCGDTYYTKAPGCNSSADRVNVENSLRPKYFEYVTLDAQGLQGSECSAQSVNPDSLCHANTIKQVHQQTGQFGYNTGFSQNIHPNCASCPSQPSPSEAYGRANQRTQVANKVHSNKKKSWMGWW